MNQSDKIQTKSELSPKYFLLWSVLLSFSFAWIFWDFLQRQFLFAVQQQADWGHTLVIPFIAGYFVWLRRVEILEVPFKLAYSGILLIVVGLSWYTVCAIGPTALHHHNLMGFGVAIAITGIVLFLFGWRSMRYLWFPLCYLFVFGQSISDRFMEIVTFKLQDIASIGSYYGLSFMGLDVTRAGNTIEILYKDISYPLNIAEACSGMRMLMAFLALGVAMAYNGLPFVWQRITLIAFAVPTAVFVNILRVMTLGLLSIADSGFAAGDFHTFVGTLWLIPAFMIYLGIVWILKNLVIVEDEDVEEPSTSSDTFRFGYSAKSGFIVAILMLTSSAIGLQVGVQSLNIYLHKEPIYPRKDFSVLPATINGWKSIGEDIRFDAAGVEALGTERYLSRVYIHEQQGWPAVQLHIAYYTGQVDAVPHVPDRCMISGGFVPLSAEPITLPIYIDNEDWEEDPDAQLDGVPYPIVWGINHRTGKNEPIRLPIGNFELRTTEFSHPNLGDDHVFAGYFFIANGKTTPYPERIRMLAFDHTQSHAYYCKIQFTMRGDRNFTVADFNRIVSDLISSMLPEIMKCLPDWAEVNSMRDQSSNTVQES